MKKKKKGGGSGAKSQIRWKKEQLTFMMIKNKQKQKYLLRFFSISWRQRSRFLTIKLLLNSISSKIIYQYMCNYFCLNTCFGLSIVDCYSDTEKYTGLPVSLSDTHTHTARGPKYRAANSRQHYGSGSCDCSKA